MISEVPAFQASDGKLFIFREDAIKHEVRINHAQDALKWIRLNTNLNDNEEISITPDSLIEMLLEFIAYITNKEASGE